MIKDAKMVFAFKALEIFGEWFMGGLDAGCGLIFESYVSRIYVIH